MMGVTDEGNLMALESGGGVCRVGEPPAYRAAAAGPRDAPPAPRGVKSVILVSEGSSASRSAASIATSSRPRGGQRGPSTLNACGRR